MITNEKQRQYRISSRNEATKKYEKTHKGFLMRLYRNMQSRIMGIQKAKYHLYQGKELLPREEFYQWAFNNEVFIYLFKLYEANNYDRRLTPSVDRIDSSRGYSIDNMEWVTHSENSRRGSNNNIRRSILQLTKDDVLIKSYNSISQACRENNFDLSRVSNIYYCCNGKIKSAYGYKWKYA